MSREKGGVFLANVTVQPRHSGSRTSCFKACWRKRIAHDLALSQPFTCPADSCKHDLSDKFGLAELLLANLLISAFFSVIVVEEGKRYRLCNEEREEYHGK